MKQRAASQHVHWRRLIARITSQFRLRRSVATMPCRNTLSLLQSVAPLELDLPNLVRAAVVRGRHEKNIGINGAQTKRRRLSILP